MTKSNRLPPSRLLVGAATLLAGMESSAFSETITVCADGCDHTSIIEAVAVASDGDVILLNAETYQEGGEIQIAGKRLTITGSLDAEDGPSARIIGDGTHRLMYVADKEASGTLLENISFEQGWTDSNDVGGAGLLAEWTTICRNCRFDGNIAASESGGGSSMGGGSRGLIHHERCLFINNAAYNGGGSFGGTYSGCQFIGNRCQQIEGRLAAAPRGAALFFPDWAEDCLFDGNGGSSVVGGDLRDCVFKSGSFFPNGGRWERCRFDESSSLSFCDWSNCTQTGTLVDCLLSGVIDRSNFGCMFEGCTFEGADPIPILGGGFDSCIFRNGSPDEQFVPKIGGCYPCYSEPWFRECSFSVSCPASPQTWVDLGGNTFAGEAGSSCPIQPCDLDFDSDGTIGPEDLGVFLSYWGQNTYCDLDHDGVFDAAELGVLLASWGTCR